MPKIVIADPRLLCAALLFTSTEQTRPYLHGVYVEPAQGGGVLLTATDGAKLFHALDEGGQCDRAAIVVPEKTKLPAVWQRKGAIWIDTEAGTMRHDGAGVIMGAREDDGIFPGYRRVVPREYSGEVAQFDLAQFAAFAAVAKILGDRAVRVSHNGSGPALMTFADEPRCYGVLAPYRAGDAPMALPELPQPLVAEG